MISEKICRTCLAEKDNLQAIFNVTDMLKVCTSIQVKILFTYLFFLHHSHNNKFFIVKGN